MFSIRRFRPYLGTFVVVILGVSLTIGFSYKNYQNNVTLLRQYTQRTLERISKHLLSETELRTVALHAVEGYVLSNEGVVSSTSFTTFAGSLSPLVPGNQAIQWVDDAHVVRYVYPLNEQNIKVVNFDNKPYPNRLEPIMRALEERRTIATEPLQLIQGFPGIIYFHPIFQNNRHIGTSVVVQRLSTLFRDIGAQVNRTNFNVIIRTASKRISDDGRILYTQDGLRIINPQGETVDESVQAPPKNQFSLSETIEIGGMAWHIDVIPTDVLIARQFSETALLATIGVLVFFLIIIYQIQLKRITLRERDFVSLVAHQLRAPATQMSWLLETFEEKVKRPSKAQADLLTDLKAISVSNRHLIDDILNVSRLERGVLRADATEIPLAELVIEAERPLASEMMLQKIKYRRDPKIRAFIMADRQKGVEVIRNVLHNAIVHTRPGTTITVTEMTAYRRNQVTLAIKDNGPGIPTEIRPQLFTRIHKRSSTGSREDGTGLGLYLAKEFMTLMHGDISVETGKNGTTFYISFPKRS